MRLPDTVTAINWVSQPSSHGVFRPRRIVQEYIQYTNLSAVLDPELYYFLQENFGRPQELLVSIAPTPPSRWTACGFAKGGQCVHESGNTQLSRRIAARPPPRR